MLRGARNGGIARHWLPGCGGGCARPLIVNIIVPRQFVVCRFMELICFSAGSGPRIHDWDVCARDQGWLDTHLAGVRGRGPGSVTHPFLALVIVLRLIKTLREDEVHEL